MAKEASASHSSSRSADYTVFIDTNFDTHLAMMVSEQDTVRDLKNKIMVEHPNCFPNMGNITIHALKVRRKGEFYHLSDAMLVTSAFTGIKKAWFLYADAALGQVERPLEDLMILDPCASKLPHFFSTANDPAVDTERNKCQIEYPLARSNLEVLTLPQVGSSDLENHLVSPAAKYGAATTIGDSQTGLSLGEKHLAIENNKSSLPGDNEKYSRSEAIKCSKVATIEKDVLKTSTQSNRNKLKKRSRGILAGDMVEDGVGGPVVKKKTAQQKNVEDSNPLKQIDSGSCISSKEEVSNPEKQSTENGSKKIADAFTDSSLCKLSENDSTLKSLVNGRENESLKFQEELDSRDLSTGGDVVQDILQEALGTNHQGLDKESEAAITINETVCGIAPTGNIAVANEAKNYGSAQELEEEDLNHFPTLDGHLGAAEETIGNLEGETGVGTVESRKDASDLTEKSAKMEVKMKQQHQPASAKGDTPALVVEPERLNGDATFLTYEDDRLGNENSNTDLIGKSKKEEGMLPQYKDPISKSLPCNESKIKSKTISDGLHGVGSIEARGPSDKQKRKSKKSRPTDVKSFGRENSPGNAVTLQMEQDRASDHDNLCNETELTKLVDGGPTDDMTERTAKEKKSLQQNRDPKIMSLETTNDVRERMVQEESGMNVEGMSELLIPISSHHAELGILSEKRKKISKKPKVTDGILALSSGLENANSTDNRVLPEPEPAKIVDSDQNGDTTNRRDTMSLRSGKKKVSKTLDATVNDNTDPVTVKKGRVEKVLPQSNHKVTSSEATDLKSKFLGTDEANGIAAGDIESGVPNHKLRKKLKKSKTSDAKNLTSSSIAEHADAARDVIPPKSAPDKTDGESFLNEKMKTSTVAGGGYFGECIVLIDEIENKEKSLNQNDGTKKSGLRTKEGISFPLTSDGLGVFDSGDTAQKMKKKGPKTNKVSDTKSHAVSCVVEYIDSEANCENIIISPTRETKMLGSGDPGIGDGIIYNAQTDRIEVEETLSQKVPEASKIVSSEAVISNSMEAQDLTEYKRKKPKKTRASKTMSHALTSGVEHVAASKPILSIASESKKASEDGNAIDETEREEHKFSQNREIEEPQITERGCTDDDELPLSLTFKVQGTAAVVTNDKRNGESIKSEPPTLVLELKGNQEVMGTGDPTAPTDENKEVATTSSDKNLQKLRSRKKVLVKKPIKMIPESSQQYNNPGNTGSSKMRSDSFENNEESPLSAAHTDETNNHIDGDKVNFFDYFTPRKGQQEVASAKGPQDKDFHVRKASKKNKKLDGHSRATLHHMESSSETVDTKTQKKKMLLGSVDANQPQAPLTKDKRSELAVQSKMKGNAEDGSKGQAFQDHDVLECLTNQDSRKKSLEGSGNISSRNPPKFPSSEANAYFSSKEHNATWETTSSSMESPRKRNYKKKGHKEALSGPYSRSAVTKPTTGNKGTVMNSSNKERLLATPNTIFQDSGDESSEVDGEVNNSNASTQTPDNSSSSDSSEGENASDLDSPETGTNNQKRKNNDGKRINQSQRSVGNQNMPLDMIFRSSSSYKKAKLTASQAQLDDSESQPVDFVPDSQA